MPLVDQRLQPIRLHAGREYALEEMRTLCITGKCSTSTIEVARHDDRKGPRRFVTMRRTLLSFVLLLCVAYAASTNAYADEAAAYWSEQAMQAPECSSPIALCVSAFAFAAMLVLRRSGARRHDHADFDSKTLVWSRPQLRDFDEELTQLSPEVFSQRSSELRRILAGARNNAEN